MAGELVHRVRARMRVLRLVCETGVREAFVSYNPEVYWRWRPGMSVECSESIRIRDDVINDIRLED